MHKQLNIEARLPDATEDDVALVPQALLGFAQLSPQLAEAPATHVFQLHVLQVLPNPLIGVQLGSVAGQPLQPQPSSRAALQELLYGSATVDGRAPSQITKSLPAIRRKRCLRNLTTSGPFKE